MFDLDSTVQLDEADYTVLHPETLEPTDWVITFAGPGHQKTQDLQRSIDRRLLKAARTGSSPFERDLTTEKVAGIVARIVRWTGLARGGQEIPFSADYASSLLMDPKYAWLRNKLLMWLADEGNFTKSSASA